MKSIDPQKVRARLCKSDAGEDREVRCPKKSVKVCARPMQEKSEAVRGPIKVREVRESPWLHNSPWKSVVVRGQKKSEAVRGKKNLASRAHKRRKTVVTYHFLGISYWLSEA